MLTNFTVKKSSRSFVNPVIKVNTSGNGTNRVPSCCDARGGHSPTSAFLLPKMYNLNLIMKEHQTNPQQGTFYKVTGLFS